MKSNCAAVKVLIVAFLCVFVLRVRAGSAPTDIQLSNSSILENQGPNTAVGMFTTTDPDLDPTFTYTLVPGAGSTDNASFNILGDTLRSSASFNFEVKNSYSIRVQTTDPTNLTFEKIFTITVTDVNETPTLAAIANQTVTQGQVLNLQAVGSDPDTTVPNNSLTYSLTAAPSWVTINASSGLILGVAANNGSGSVTVKVTDGGALSATQSFSITVGDVNDAPTLAPIANQVVAQNAALSVNAVGTDIDPVAPNNTLLYSLVSAPSWVSIASGTGVISGTAPNNGSGQVKVRVTDGGGLLAETTFNISVTDVNDGPALAAIANQTLTQGQVLNLQAVGTDIDPAAPNNTLTYSLTTALTWVTINASTGQISGVAPNNGGGSVTVTVTDGGLLTASRTFSITVNDVNDPPSLAVIPTQTVTQGNTLNVTAVGTDIDPAAPNSTLTYTLVSGPSWISIAPSTGVISGTAPNNGGGTVKVRVTDGGGLLAETTFNVVVTDVNDPPALAAIPNVTITQGQTLNIQAVGSDIDPAPTNNTLTYSLTAAPAWVTISAVTGHIAGIAANAGSGTVTVKVTDGTGASASQTFSITVLDVNDPPTLAPIANQTLAQNSTLSVSAVGSDIDPAAPNNTLTYSIISSPSWVTINSGSGAFGGAAPNNGSGQVRVRVTDGGGMLAETTFNITVTDVNDAPTLAVIANQTLAQGQVLNVQAVGADIDPAAPNNSLTYSLTTVLGWVNINAATGQISGVAPNNGSGSVTVTVTDGALATASRTFSITVSDVNEGPSLPLIPTQTVAQGTALSVSAAGTDPDPAGPNSALTYSLPSGPAWVSINAGSGLITGTAPNNGGGTVRVRAVDGGGLFTETTFLIVVTDVNDAPALAPISNQTIAQGQVLNLQAVGSDIDPAAPNNTLTYSLTTALSWVSINANTGQIGGVAPNGPGGNVTVTVTDGGSLTASRTFAVTVTDVNDAPALAGIANQTVTQGNALSVNAIGSDIDPAAPNNTLTYSLPRAPSWVNIVPSTGAIGGVAPNNGGGLVTVRVTDGGGLFAETIFNITVTDVNDAPTLAAIANQTVTQGQVMNVQAVGADIDPAAPNNTLTYSLTTAPPWVTINASSGLITGVASNNAGGTVTVKVTDGAAASASQTFSITVTDVNDAPSLAPIANQNVLQGNALTVTAAGSDIDPAAPNNVLTYSIVSAPSWVTINSGSGAFGGTAPNNGGGTVKVRVTDGGGLLAEQTFNVTVVDVNDAPSLAAIANQTVTQGQVLNVQAVGSDIDPAAPNNTLIYSLTAAPSWVNINPATGQISGVAANNGGGTVTVRVADGGAISLSTTQTFTITVLDINDPPALAVIPNQTLAQGQTLNVTAVGSDIDPAAPNNTLTYSILSGPSWIAINSGTGALGGVAVNNGGGAVTVEVADGGNLKAARTFNITVTDVNDAPLLDLIADQTVLQNAAFSLQVTGRDSDPAAPNNTLTYSITSTATPWLSIAPATGLITGTAPNGGSGSVTVKVTDGVGATAQRTFAVTVVDVNEAPALAVIANQTVVQNAALSVTAVGSDIDPAAPNNTLTYSLVVAPSWVSINAATGAITGTAPNAGGGTVIVRVSDGGGLFAERTFTVTVTDVNDAPTLAAIPNQTITQNQVLSLLAQGADIDPAAPNNTLTYSLTAAPSWVSINPANGVISGQAANNGGGTVTVKVTDGGTPQLSASQTFTITVLDVNDAPTLAAITNKTVVQGAALSATAVGSDIDPAAPNNALTYSLISAPSWVSINGNTGAISGTAPNRGDGTVVVRVTDGGGLFAEKSFSITVTDVNDPPQLEAIADVTITQNQVLSLFAHGTDIDPAAPNNVLTYQLVSAPSWVTIDPATGFISGQAANNKSGDVTVTVTDTPGLVATRTFHITVLDVNDPPTLAPIANQTVIQNQPLVLTAVGSDIDPAAPNNTLHYSLVVAPAWVTIDPVTGAFGGTAPNKGGGTVTVAVTDGGGLTAAQTFKIDVTDVNDAPALALIPDQTIVQNSSLSLLAIGSDIDPAAPNNTLTYSLAAAPQWVSVDAATGLISGTVSNNGSGTVTVLVTDGGATPLSATRTFRITVVDINEAPSLAPIADVFVVPGEALNVTAVGSDPDPAAPNNLLAYSITSGPSWVGIEPGTGKLFGTAPPHGSGVVLVRVTDGGSLSAEKSFVLTVLDIISGPTVAPNPAKVGEAVVLFASANVANVTWVWNFGDGLSDGSGNTVQHAYAAAGVFTITVTATLTSGQSLSQSLTIVVNPTTGGPVLAADEVDTDHDGFTDAIETVLGSNPNDAYSTPLNNQPAGTPRGMTIAGMGVKLNFAFPSLDSITISGTLPLTGVPSFAGQKAVVDVGGILRVFTLNKAGSSRLGRDILTISPRTKNGLSKFNITLSKGTFAGALADEGLISTASVSKVPVTVYVSIIFNGSFYQAKRNMLYTSSQAVKGSAR